MVVNIDRDVIEALQAELRGNSMQMEQLNLDISQLTSVVRDMVSVTEEARIDSRIAA